MATAVAPHDAFAVLDAGGSSVAPTWVHAGAMRAEAGFEDPALGWVGVRAELGASGVHASLVPGSTDAAQALGTHLAGLNAYVAEHHAGVSTVTLSSPESRSAHAGVGQGEAGAAHQQLGQQAQPGSGEERGTNPRVFAGSSGTNDSIAAKQGSVDFPVAFETPGPTWIERGAGVHISVMA